MHAEVQVTDFVSRLEIGQHSGAKVSESSLCCFSTSTWNQSTVELQVLPLPARTRPSLYIWAPTFWLNSSELAREVPKCLLTSLGDPSGMFRACLTHWTSKIYYFSFKNNHSPSLWEPTSLITILETLSLEGCKSITPTAKETGVITTMDTSHGAAFHSGWATSQRRMEDSYCHRENKWERCISVHQHKGWLPTKEVLDSAFLPQLFVDLFND